MYNDLINRSIFKDIKDKVAFRNYDSLSDMHSKTYISKPGVL